MKKKFMAAAIVLSVSLIAGCGQNQGGNIVPDQTGVEDWENSDFNYGTTYADRFSGVIVAGEETKIERNYDNEIGEIAVSEGDVVETGQLLFSYNTEMMQMSLETAKLDLEKQKMTLDTMKSDKEKMEKEAEKAPESQKLNYSLEIRGLAAQITEAEYNLKLKENEIARIESQLESTTVESPVSGIVKSVNKDNSDPYSGNAFITIVEEGSYRVKGKINETNMGAIYVGMNVRILSRVNDSVYEGMITKIDTEKPDNGNNDGFYYGPVDEYGSSTSYPFYVELTSVGDLMLGQHVYIEPVYEEDFNYGGFEDGVMVVE